MVKNFNNSPQNLNCFQYCRCLNGPNSSPDFQFLQFFFLFFFPWILWRLSQCSDNDWHNCYFTLHNFPSFLTKVAIYISRFTFFLLFTGTEKSTIEDSFFFSCLRLIDPVFWPGLSGPFESESPRTYHLYHYTRGYILIMFIYHWSISSKYIHLHSSQWNIFLTQSRPFVYFSFSIFTDYLIHSLVFNSTPTTFTVLPFYLFPRSFRTSYCWSIYLEGDNLPEGNWHDSSQSPNQCPCKHLVLQVILTASDVQPVKGNGLRNLA